MRKLFFLLLLISFTITAQHQSEVDFIEGEVTIAPIPLDKKITGFVSYTFEVLKDIDSIFLDAKNMTFKNVSLNGNSIKYQNSGEKITLRKKFKKGEKYQLTLNYSCTPKQTVYFLGWDDTIDGNEQIWTQGQGKYTSHWLPSFDAMEEKVTYDLSFDNHKISGFEIISNGHLKEVKSSHNGGSIISFDMKKPISSYLLAFAIGNYNKQRFNSASGISIENYYYPKDSLKVEPTYRYTATIFNFLEKEIGYSYPWQNYKQIPVHDFLYAGMENTTATIFSDQYVIDSTAFIDKNYVNVNAHELAHQWFGNLVTEKNSKHHWLHEGFATYYAYLAEQHLFGDDHFYWKFHKTLHQLKTEIDKGNGQSLLDPKASSLTFYEKGAWALFALQNRVGDINFKKGIKNYLKKYQFKNVKVADFLNEIETASTIDLSDFKKEWLASTAIPFDKCMKLLESKSPSIKLLSELEHNLQTSQNENFEYYSYWKLTNSTQFKKHILKTYKTSLPKKIYDEAYNSNALGVRQALVGYTEVVKNFSKQEIETFLNDNSYVTQEAALYILWQNYPKERNIYLDEMKNVIGLPNKNIRVLWLTLAMLTENYNARKTKLYFDELSAYTGAEYSFEIRQSALFYLNEAFGLNEMSLTNLVKATNHHSWQFKKFARNLVVQLLNDTDYKIRLKELAAKLKPEESRYLLSKLKIK